MDLSRGRRLGVDSDQNYKDSKLKRFQALEVGTVHEMLQGYERLTRLETSDIFM